MRWVQSGMASPTSAAAPRQSGVKATSPRKLPSLLAGKNRTSIDSHSEVARRFRSMSDSHDRIRFQILSSSRRKVMDFSRKFHSKFVA